MVPDGHVPIHLADGLGDSHLVQPLSVLPSLGDLHVGLDQRRTRRESDQIDIPRLSVLLDRVHTHECRGGDIWFALGGSLHSGR